LIARSVSSAGVGDVAVLGQQDDAGCEASQQVIEVHTVEAQRGRDG
jgi:hypothetical protein